MMINEPLTFVHLSDLHILPEGEQFLGQDTLQKARNAVEAIRSLELRPAFVLISGDLSHRGEPESYRRLNVLLDEFRALDLPVLLGLGNHDVRAAFRSEVLGEAGATEQQAYYYSAEIDGLRIVMLDSKIPGTHDGALDSEQLDWLDGILATSAPRGTLLVFHHPPFETANAWLAGHGLRNAAQVATLIRGRDVVGILSGHIHFSAIGAVGGVTTAAAPGVAFTLDPVAQHGLRILDGSGFNIGHVHGSTLSVNPVLLPGPQAELIYFRPDEANAAELAARLH